VFTTNASFTNVHVVVLVVKYSVTIYLRSNLIKYINSARKRNCVFPYLLTASLVLAGIYIFLVGFSLHSPSDTILCLFTIERNRFKMLCSNM